jgi:hypothetical protein
LFFCLFFKAEEVPICKLPDLHSGHLLHEESNRHNGFPPSLKSEEKFQILAEEKLQFELKSVSSPDLHSWCLPKSEDMRVRERGREKKKLVVTQWAR